MTQYLEQFEIALNQPGESFNFYTTPSLQQHLDLLTHLMQFSELLLYIDGPEGIGKTALVHAFTEQQRDNWRVCLLNGQDFADPQQLISRLIKEFLLPPVSGHDTPQQMLIEYFEKLQDADQLPIIIIDDADELNIDTLRALLYLAPEPHHTLAAVHILLSGNQTLKARLKTIGIYDVSNPPIHEMKLLSLDEKQTTDYLEQRIRAANLPIDFPFSTKDMALIYHASQGIPAQIHECALYYYQQQIQTPNQETVLIPPYEDEDEEEKKNEDHQPTLIARYFPAAFISIVLLSLLWWQEDINRLFEPVNTTPTVSQQELPLPQSTASLLDSTPIPILTANTETIPEPIEILPEPEITVITPIKIEATPTPKIIAPPEVIAEVLAPQPTPIAPIIAKPLPIATAESTLPVTKTSAQLHQKDWLLQQNPKHYTLQLLSARKQASVVDFSNKFKLKQGLAHFYHEVKGVRWHVLTTGTYPSYKAAQQAIAALPKALQANKPWPRSLSGIQQAIRKLDNKTP